MPWRMPWPRSMLGRNVLLLIALVVVSELCAALIFLEFVQRPRIDEAASLVASQIALTERLLQALPEERRAQELIEMRGAPTDSVPLEAIHLQTLDSYAMQRFVAHLVEQMPPDTQIRWERGPQHRLWVRLAADGRYYWIMLPVTPMAKYFTPWSIICLLLSLAAFPTLGAYIIHWRIKGPLQRLAQAAASIKNGVWPEPVPLAGPLELSTVTEVFNQMVQVQQENEAARAVILAGVSHDIRTPLTKLRMLVSAPHAFEQSNAAAERCIEEIDLIVQQFIDYARGCENETAVLGDLNALIEQLAGDYTGLGYTFELALDALPTLTFCPASMQRLLMNLMQNAVLYGGIGLAVSTVLKPDCVVVTVEDGGPGVSSAALPFLTQPFYRAGDDIAAKGGTGLGLAIAERIAQQHGGRLDLSLRDEGGLAARIRLPRR